MIVVVGLGLAYLIAVVVAIGRIQFHKRDEPWREVKVDGSGFKYPRYWEAQRHLPYEQLGQKQP